MKTLQNHFVRSALFLLFALLYPVLGWGQGVPNLNNDDFSITLTKGNTTCNKPGVLQIRYRNAVAGLQTLHYELLKNGVLTYVQDVNPNDVFTQPLEDLEDGDRFWIQVRGVTTGGMETPTYSLYDRSLHTGDFTYSIQAIDAADMNLRSEGVGGCSGMGGRLSMSMNMAGFSKVEWKVYQSGTLLKTIDSTTPELLEKVDQLAAGTYRVVARATPACPTTHPTPTTPGASWDGDVLVLTRDVKIGAFDLGEEYISSTLGSCGANLNWQVLRTSGISSVTAEILPRGGSVALKTMTTNVMNQFYVFFEDVPAGDYTLRLTADCGSVETKDFSVKSGTLSVYAYYQNSDQNINPCAKGYVQCSSNAPMKESVTYRLIRESTNEVIATKTWKYSQEENQCLINGLVLIAGEKYFVEASVCGVTGKSETFIAPEYKPNIGWEVLSTASGICAGEGGKVKIKITTPQSLPLTSKGTLEVLNPDGTVLFNQSMPEGWSGEVILNDVSPLSSETYTLRFTLDCNGLVSEYPYANMWMTGSGYNIDMKYTQTLDQCTYRYTLGFRPTGTAGNGYQSIKDGTFELRKDDGTLVWQGAYVPDFANTGYMNISLPGEGTYMMLSRNSCGSFRLINSINVKKRDVFEEGVPRKVDILKLPLPCYDTGEIRIGNMNPMYGSYHGDQGISLEEVQWKLEKDGVLYRQGTFKKQGSFVEEDGSERLKDLPPGKYKFTSYLACDPTIKSEDSFELKTEIMPSFFESTGSCGTKILGQTRMGFNIFNVDNQRVKEDGMSFHRLMNYSYRLYNADTGVFYQEGDLTSCSGGNYRMCFQQAIPNGNYRMEIRTPMLICGGIPAYNYNFTVPTLPDNALSLASQRDKNDLIVEHTSYRSNNGSLTVGLYKRQYSDYIFVDDNFPVVFTLRAKNGSFTKTLTANGAEHNVKFENLPAGLYELSATIEGNNCVPAREVKIETVANDQWSASAHLSPLCAGGPKQRQRHVSFRVAGSDPSLATVVYTFKTYVWDDVAADYVLAKSVTGAPGQLTAMVDITTYAGTSAPSLNSYDVNAPLLAYKYTIEAGSEEVYSTYDLTDAMGGIYDYNQLVKCDKTDATFTTNKGKVTVQVNPVVSVYGGSKRFPQRLSLQDKIEWRIQRNDGSNAQTKTATLFESVTFDQLAPGQYSVMGNIRMKNCVFSSNNYNTNVEILTPGVHLQATGTDGKCDSDCKITVKVLDDAAAFSKVTYTITYIEEGNEKEKTLSTSDATQEKVFDGLPAGNYKVKAEAEVLTSDGLRTFTANSEVVLKTESPNMNIIQHVVASRPSFKNCATGYLAFKFQDITETTFGDVSTRFNDDYEFTITEAPAGVTLPLTFKVVPAEVLSTNSAYKSAITPFRNLPAGEYKVKVTNHCKTLFLTCRINQIEDLDIPAPWGCINFALGSNYNYDYEDYNYYTHHNNYYAYGPLNIRRNKGKYYFYWTPFASVRDFFLQYSNNYQYLVWDDLITQDIHDSFGHEMTNIPMSWEPKEMTVRPWAIDKVTLKFNCPAIADKVFTGVFSSCRTEKTYCGQPIVNVTDLIRRARLPETFTLVVNELNGTTIGAEVLRKINPNQTYSLPDRSKTYLVRLYTHDNFVLLEYSMSPVQVENTMTLEAYSNYDCKATSISIRYSRDIVDCYAPYVLKTYVGSGATRTLLRETLINRYIYTSTFTYRSDYSPNTDYEFELYTADGVLLDRKGIHTPPLISVTLPTTYYFGNRCSPSNTVVHTYASGDGSYKNDMYYRLKHIYADTWDYSKKYYEPDNNSVINETTYRGKPMILTVVKDGKTYRGDLRGLGTTVTTIDSWTVERNGKLYPSEGPVFAWNETINGTLTTPECGLSVNITGKALKKESNFEHTHLENMTMVQTCTGWDIIPGGQVSYTAVDGSRHTSTYKEYLDPYTGQWKDVTLPFAQPKSPNSFRLRLRGDDLCDITVDSSPLLYKPHTLNQIESASYYCSGDNKGRIYVGAQDGVPPYKYELLNGENETDPVVETKTDTGPVVFEYGNVGQKYRVHVWDACGNLRIHYLTTVVSTVDLGYQLSKTRQFCTGDNLKLTIQSFPGATYDWTLPDGSHLNTRIIDLGPATRAMAGVYNVVITPADCNSTINATITVVVDDIGAPTWTPAVQTICQGTTATISPGAAQSYTDNTPGTPKYQWQKRDPYATNFIDIDGATLADYTFQGDNPGAYTFRRVTTYKGCEHTSEEARIVVTPGPIQTLSPIELERTVRKGSTGYTLTGGSLQTNGTTIASYKWERSTDGVVWTTVGTSANYKETQKFKLEKVYYRRTVTPTVGTCAHTTPTITVNFKKVRPAYVNPHIRLRVKSE